MRLARDEELPLSKGSSKVVRFVSYHFVMKSLSILDKKFKKCILDATEI